MDAVTDYAWSTHQPLLYTLLEAFKPQFIMELGVGFYSTPVFTEYNPKKLISVENDLVWLEHVKSTSDFSKDHTLIHHDLGTEITKFNFYKDLTLTQESIIRNYYININNEYMIEDLQPKLLFVDNFTCCRTIAINTLYQNYDIIVYHDAEGVDWYEYYFDKEIKNNFNGYILKTERSWTGCFINKKLEYSDSGLQEIIWPHILKYCQDNKSDLVAMYLQREI